MRKSVSFPGQKAQEKKPFPVTLTKKTISTTELNVWETYPLPQWVTYPPPPARHGKICKIPVEVVAGTVGFLGVAFLLMLGVRFSLRSSD